MSARIVADDETNAAKPGRRLRRAPAFRWQLVLYWGVLLALLAIALGMRLYGLGLPFDRDGYDEGVYWQTLLSMHAGYTLYQQIFYSQPPFFILSTYPFYILFGSTLWSARLGIALVSLLGLAGALSMGKALSGRLGAIAAVFLLVIDPLYLSQSQKIQAEVSSTAFSFLAVGAAYLWWEIPEGAVGFSLAAISGVALSLGILCKLLSVTSIVPISLLLLARLWQIWRKKPGTNWRSLRPMILLVIASVGTMLVVLLPFLGAYASMVQDVITFHTDAKSVLINDYAPNMYMLQTFLLSNLPLVIAAFVGLISAMLRRDWRVIPLVAWIFVTTYMLMSVVPLFSRHFIALDPPLIAMAVMGVSRTFPADDFLSRYKLSKIMPALAVLLILFIGVMELLQYPLYYRNAKQQGSHASTRLQMQVASDLRNAITPGQLVVTDGQFETALADRRTPPGLVDTSMVRIDSGYLTQQQLESEASQPNVHAVLFFKDRLRLPQVAGFYTWVTQHFHLKYWYGPGKELWVR